VAGGAEDRPAVDERRAFVPVMFYEHVDERIGIIAEMAFTATEFVGGRHRGLSLCQDGSCGILDRDLGHLVGILDPEVIDRRDRNAVNLKVISFLHHRPGESVVQVRVLQVEPGIRFQDRAEQFVHVERIPELGKGPFDRRNRCRIVDDPVVDADARGDNLGSRAPPDNLGPDGVVRGEDDGRVVAGVEAVHPQIVPGNHNILVADRRRSRGDGQADGRTGGCGGAGSGTLADDLAGGDGGVMLLGDGTDHQANGADGGLHVGGGLADHIGDDNLSRPG